MNLSSYKLSAKLATISTAFLIVACLAIGLTLIESWNLEGAGAAINALGSERMRSYHIAYLLAAPPSASDHQQLDSEIAQFEKTLQLIKHGDPVRPLYLPKSETVHQRMLVIESDWATHIRPLLEHIRTTRDARHKTLLQQQFHDEIELFVANIDALVYILERHSDNNLSSLRTLQVGLLVLALLGTFVLIGLMYLVVVRPIHTLRDGMLRMREEDFSVRLPQESTDELGELAKGFNGMAGHLQQLYVTLEQQIQEKTRILEERRDELKTLYDIIALLNRTQNQEDMCREFLGKLVEKYGAEGGMIRLVDKMEHQIHLYVHAGLSQEFAVAEQCKHMGECFCGEVTARNAATVHMVKAARPHADEYYCLKAGYATVLALPILLYGHSIGLCNLFFRSARELQPYERKLLETLAQHLGIAIESQRMVAAEKELAISAERNLLAQELHDSIAQSLAFLNLQAQMLETALQENNMQEAQENLAGIRAGVQESYDDVRELLVHFRTRVSHSDLETELARALYKYETQSGIKTSFMQAGTALPLPIEHQAQVLYIVQEALSNIRKHARASAAEVEMQRGDVYVFTIRDNGCGLDEASIDNGRHGGIGMTIMRERAQRIGGWLDIHSRPEQGTQVVLHVPVIKEKGS
ncbi:MAG TPA: histidine kinase [Novimethylophilus sp.]|uniref:histidine kinase n=1 Tax=Novimethylophilus sp. TaxID=2137426 RepID=UPI002F409777